MAALQCEICGGKLMGKPGGVFECDSCGMQYDKTRVQEMVQEIRGTVKIEGPVEVTGTVKVEGGPSVDSLLKRGWMHLGDRDWDAAKAAFDGVLNIDPENGEAYTGLFCAGMRYTTPEDMAADSARVEQFGGNPNLQKALRFSSGGLKTTLDTYIAAAKQLKEEKEAEAKYEMEHAIARLAARRAELAKAAGILAAGYEHTVGLKSDGTVVAAGSNEFGQCDVSNWRDIVAVSAGNCHTVGLKSDGTVVAKGKNDTGQCSVDSWTDIAAVSAGYEHTVGLKSNGTVVAVGDNNMWGQCDVGGWTDIVAVAAGNAHTVGLKSDGTVVAAGRPWSEACHVGNWTDIVAIGAGAHHTVGLKTDGTVVAVGMKDHLKKESWEPVSMLDAVTRVDYGQCNVGDWTDIVGIAAGGCYTVGLRADGTVVAAGGNIMRKCSVENWTDVFAVGVDTFNIMGLKADGTVMAAIGYAGKGQCDIDDWKLFNSIDTIEQERKEAIVERKHQDGKARQQRIAVLEAERQSIQAELPNIKGLFSGGKRRELEARLEQIEKELKEL